MTCEKYKNISNPIDAFRKYFLDVKPYHTKILEILERYSFSESINVKIKENIKTNISISNDPLCKPTGWGIDWDNSCGFDALNCCDLFDCIGGYGLIFDNSKLVSSAPIISLGEYNNSFSVSGDRTYDLKIQIKEIIASDSFTLEGNYTSYFENSNIFLVIPKHTYKILSVLNDGFNISGNHANEFLYRKKFLVYGCANNNSKYSVKGATYDSNTNITKIQVYESIKTPAINYGFIEINSSNKNNGVYQVLNSSFDGVNTTVVLNSSVRTLSILDDITNGSVQLKTGFIYPRYVNIENTETVDTNDYRIIQSTYDPSNNVTIVNVTKNINQTIDENSIANLYGYLINPGYDADKLCSTPKEFNVRAVFSEKLVINVLLPSTPTPTPTKTPTPTPTPTNTTTPSVTPTNTLTPTITATPTVTASITPTVTVTLTPTPTVTPTPSVTVTPTPTPPALEIPLLIGNSNMDLWKLEGDTLSEFNQREFGKSVGAIEYVDGEAIIGYKSSGS